MNEQLLAKRLKELRESMNLTQSQFGDLINVAQTTLSFTSYSDIFNLIVNICKSIHIDIEEYHYSQDDYNMSLVVKNSILNEFLTKWGKVKALYEDHTLDADTYEIVVKSLIDNYAKNTLKYDKFVLEDILNDITF